MREIGIFDVLGPNMIGPSSSHTAGALRIAQLAGKLAPGRVVSAVFTLYGSFANTYRGHGTDRALVGGILGFSTEDERIRDSFEHAAAAGLSYSFAVGEDAPDMHPNTVDVSLFTEGGATVTVRGVSVGGGAAKIEQINGVQVELSGEYHTLFITQRDRPGVAAHITQVIGDCGINIAFMRIYRQQKGELAYTFIEADEPIPPDVLVRIRGSENILGAMIIKL